MRKLTFATTSIEGGRWARMILITKIYFNYTYAWICVVNFVWGGEHFRRRGRGVGSIGSIGSIPRVQLGERRRDIRGAAHRHGRGQPTKQSRKQPINQPANQPTNQPTNESTKQPTNQPTSQPTNQPTNLLTYLPTYQPTNQPTNQATNLLTD